MSLLPAYAGSDTRDWTNVRFAPKATELVRRGDSLHCANSVINAVQQISTGLRRYVGLWSAADTRGQSHRKHRPLARLARHSHVAAHQAGKLAGDGKAESRAPETLCGRGIGLGELLE